MRPLRLSNDRCNRGSCSGNGGSYDKLSSTTTIATVTAISVITTALRSQRSSGRDISYGNGGHIDHCDHGGHCRQCRGRGGFADAGRPCGTAHGGMSRRSPPARGTASPRWPVGRPAAAAACWPVGRRRWPAGFPGSARRR